METQENLLIDIEQEIILIPATVGQRFANYLIDLVCFYFLSFLGGLILDITGNADLLDSNAFAYAFSFGLLFTYYLVAEGLGGRTVGKLITGTRAVNEDGTPMTFNTVFLRNLSRIVPFEPFSALNGNPWHDRWTRTCVVQKPK